MDKDIFQREKTENATFVVQVHITEDSAWQGTIKWVETGKQAQFHSSMELLQMIDQSMEEK